MTTTIPALPTTMRGVIMHAPGKVSVEDREVPRVVEPTDAVLKIEAACICGSDLWPYRGIQPVDKARPMGHEYVGTVVEIGSEVTNVKIGDFVVGSFCVSDNTCEICRSGFQSRCIHGGFMGDTQSQYTRVPQADGTLVVVPGGKPDDPEVMADVVIAERGEEGAAEVKELTDGYGAHGVVEAVGNQVSMDQAIASCRPGGHVGYVGVAHDVTLDGSSLFFAEVTLLGGPAPVRRFLPDLIDRILKREIHPGRVFTMRLPLEEAAEGYAAMDERRAIKVLLEV